MRRGEAQGKRQPQERSPIAGVVNCSLRLVRRQDGYAHCACALHLAVRLILP